MYHSSAYQDTVASKTQATVLIAIPILKTFLCEELVGSLSSVIGTGWLLSVRNRDGFADGFRERGLLVSCEGEALDGVDVPKVCGSDDGRLDSSSVDGRIEGSADGRILGLDED